MGFKDIDVELQEETFRINVCQHSILHPISDVQLGGGEGLMTGPRPITSVPSYSRITRGKGEIRNYLFGGRDDRSETWQGAFYIPTTSS